MDVSWRHARICMEGGRTAPCAGYWRASAMWSEESFAGRASRAVRNVLQKVTSDILAVENRGRPILDILSWNTRPK
jgi:hypothetical protein